MQMDKKPAPIGVFSDLPILVVSWFGAAFTTLIFSLLFMVYLSQPQLIQQTNQSFKLYAALPETNMEIVEAVEHSDARAKIIENFFKGYNAPLAALSEVFVTVADKYSLDYRLLPSIAMQESNGGKRIISNSFNPFGYGIYGSQVKKFTNYAEAIERVAKGIKEDYIDQGLNTPQKMMPKYTPPSVALGGPWAKGVSTFMEELR
jgi:hypothetical protein